MSGSFSETLEERMTCPHVDALEAHSRKLSGEGGALFVALELLMLIGRPWENSSLSWWFHAVVIIGAWAVGLHVITLQYWVLPQLVKEAVQQYNDTQAHRGLYPCENAHELVELPEPA